MGSGTEHSGGAIFNLHHCQTTLIEPVIAEAKYAVCAVKPGRIGQSCLAESRSPLCLRQRRHKRNCVISRGRKPSRLTGKLLLGNVAQRRRSPHSPARQTKRLEKRAPLTHDPSFHTPVPKAVAPLSQPVASAAPTAATPSACSGMKSASIWFATPAISCTDAAG